MSDIDALLRYLQIGHTPNWYEHSTRWHAALTALIAEHDALRAERDEVRKSYCSLMEAYRGGDGRVTANKLGWGYLFEEDGK